MTRHPPTYPVYPVYPAMVEAAMSLRRAARAALDAAQSDLDAMLLAQRIETAEAALLRVDPALAPDSTLAASDSILAATATEAGQSRSGCAGLLAEAAARLDLARARAEVLPHGLLTARAALSEAIHECTILGEVR